MLVIKICTFLLDNLFAGYRYSTTFHSLDWNSQPPSGMTFIYARDNDILYIYIHMHLYISIYAYLTFTYGTTWCINHIMHIYIYISIHKHKCVHVSYLVSSQQENTYVTTCWSISWAGICHHTCICISAIDIYIYIRTYILTYVYIYINKCTIISTISYVYL